MHPPKSRTPNPVVEAPTASAAAVPSAAAAPWALVEPWAVAAAWALAACLAAWAPAAAHRAAPAKVAEAAVVVAALDPAPRYWRLPIQPELAMRDGPFSCSSLPHLRSQLRTRSSGLLLRFRFPRRALLSLILGTCRLPRRIFVKTSPPKTTGSPALPLMAAGRFCVEHSRASRGSAKACASTDTCVTDSNRLKYQLNPRSGQHCQKH